MNWQALTLAGLCLAAANLIANIVVNVWTALHHGRRLDRICQRLTSLEGDVRYHDPDGES